MSKKPLFQLAIYDNGEEGEVRLTGSHQFSVDEGCKCLEAFGDLAKEMMPGKKICITADFKHEE